MCYLKIKFSLWMFCSNFGQGIVPFLFLGNWKKKKQQKKTLSGKCLFIEQSYFVSWNHVL